MTPKPKTSLGRVQAYTGLAGVIVIWVGIIKAMSLAGLHFIDQRPISYLGINPNSAALFSGTLIVSAFLFLAFGLYLKTTLNLNNRFFNYLLVGQIGQLVAAIIPYGGPLKLVHTVAAFALAFSLPFLISQFALAQAGSPHSNIYKILLRLEQITFLVGISIFVFTRGIAPIGEALPTIGFHIWIITVTFLLVGRPRA